MTTRNRADLEKRPHYVYLHRDASGEIIYIGRTADPEKRPYNPAGRDWMKTVKTTVEIRGSMPFTEACQLEADLIREHTPRFNKSRGWDEVGASNRIADRIRRECYIPRQVAIRISEQVDPGRLDEEIASRKHFMWGGLADDLDLSKPANRKMLRQRLEEREKRDTPAATVKLANHLDALLAAQIES